MMYFLRLEISSQQSLLTLLGRVTSKKDMGSLLSEIRALLKLHCKNSQL